MKCYQADVWHLFPPYKQPCFMLGSSYTFFLDSGILKLWQTVPPYGSLSVYFVCNTVSPFKPRKVFFSLFKNDFYSHCSGFIVRNLNNSILYLLLPLMIFSCFFYIVEEHLKIAFHIWVHILKVSILILTFFKWILIMCLHPYSSYNPFLFPLTPFSSLLLLYVWLTTPISYIPPSSCFILSKEF